jgi:hypothetical protein
MANQEQAHSETPEPVLLRMSRYRSAEDWPSWLASFARAVRELDMVHVLLFKPKTMKTPTQGGIRPLTDIRTEEPPQHWKRGVHLDSGDQDEVTAAVTEVHPPTGLPSTAESRKRKPTDPPDREATLPRPGGNPKKKWSPGNIPSELMELEAAVPSVFFNLITGRMESPLEMAARTELWVWLEDSLETGPMHTLTQGCVVPGDIRWVYTELKARIQRRLHAKIIIDFLKRERESFDTDQLWIQIGLEADKLQEKVLGVCMVKRVKIPEALRRAAFLITISDNPWNPQHMMMEEALANGEVLAAIRAVQVPKFSRRGCHATWIQLTNGFKRLLPG